MKALIRADASPAIGGGHVMRCLTLADELAGRGFEIVFAAASMLSGAARLIQQRGYGLVPIAPAAPDDTEGRPGWESTAWAADVQREDARRTLAAAGPADWIICDHYKLDAQWEAAVRPAAGAIAVIDDLASRPHDCDLLLDQTLGRLSADYQGLVPASARILAGANFALLRPEFRSLRKAALRSRHARSGQNLLIALGATDIGGHTIAAFEAARPHGWDGRIDVVIGAEAPSRAALAAAAARDQRCRLHVDSLDMARLIARADVAIGTAGASSWERCCLGLPSVALVVADNQRLIADRLAREGAALLAGSPEEAGGLAAGLLRDGDARAAMTAAAAAIVDGAGAVRVADAIVGAGAGAPRVPLRLRPATRADSELLWLWRNDPTMRAMAKTHEPVPWRSHSAWFEKALADERVTLYLAEAGDGPAAMVRFDRQIADAVVSINVDPARRGQGVGRDALAAACARYAAAGAASRLIAEVHSTNTASKRIFAAAGFSEAGPAQSGYVRYSLPLGGEAAERPNGKSA